MLLYPSIDDLKKKVDSKYTLAILASKRARDIIDKKPTLMVADNDKPLSVATAEISADLVGFTRPTAEELASEEVQASAAAAEEAEAAAPVEEA